MQIRPRCSRRSISVPPGEPCESFPLDPAHAPPSAPAVPSRRQVVAAGPGPADSLPGVLRTGAGPRLLQGLATRDRLGGAALRRLQCPALRGAGGPPRRYGEWRALPAGDVYLDQHRSRAGERLAGLPADARVPLPDLPGADLGERRLSRAGARRGADGVHELLRGELRGGVRRALPRLSRRLGSLVGPAGARLRPVRHCLRPASADPADLAVRTGRVQADGPGGQRPSRRRPHQGLPRSRLRALLAPDGAQRPAVSASWRDAARASLFQTYTLVP